MPLAELQLTGKVALVMGGGTAVGRAIAVGLAEAGADVAVASSTPSPQGEVAVNSVANEVWALGRRGFAASIDATDAAQVQAVVERTVQELGRLDILVNNQDTPFAKPVTEMTVEEWNRVLAANLTAAFLAAKAAAPIMLGQGKGKVINISSFLGERGLINGAAYCAAHGGIINLTRALALEWARSGICVNAVGLGPTYDVPGLAEDVSTRAALEHYLPFRRLAQPEEAAATVVYLASDGSDFLTGQTLFLDGGALAHA